MTEVKRKRHRLSKMRYDEVSLVDVGANQHAHVVIAKAGPYSAEPSGDPIKPQGLSAKQRKTLEDDAVKQRQKARDKQRKERDKAESERGENWKEGRHKRRPAGSPAGGEFDTTSDESKRKYGRGGTTQEKLDRLERRKQHLLDRKKREDEELAQEKVKAGDTLWDMAVQHYGDGRKWKLIAAANGIKDPKKLQVGAVLEIPKDKDSGSSRSRRRRRSSSDDEGYDYSDPEDETREKRLATLKAKKKQLQRLLEDLNDEESTRGGDLRVGDGIIVKPDGTVVHKIHPRRRPGGVK